MIILYFQEYKNKRHINLPSRTTIDIEMHPCLRGALIIIVVLAILTVLGFMVAGPVIIVYNTDAAMTSDYVSSTCVLSSPIVLTNLDISWCYNTQYTPIWKSKDGYSITQYPHDIYASFQNAESQLSKYPLNVTLQCLCDSSKISNKYVYPNISYQMPCQIYSRCFVDVATVKDTQARIYQLNLGGILTVIGYGILGLCLIIVILYWIIFSCCDCCKRCCGNYERI